MTANNIKKVQAADSGSAACPLCTAKFDVLLLDLLRQWRGLWQLLGQLQHLHHAVEHGDMTNMSLLVASNTVDAMNGGMNNDTNGVSNSMFPYTVEDHVRTHQGQR